MQLRIKLNEIMSSKLIEPHVLTADMGSITCKCNQLQLQLLWNFMITDYNYNYFFLNVIYYNYRLHCKVIMITL